MNARVIKYADIAIEYAVYVFVLAMFVSTSLWQAALALILLAWSIKHAVSRGGQLDYLRHPLMWVGLAFCSMVLISAFYMPDTLEGLRVYKNTIGAAMILLLAIPDIFKDERRQHRLFVILACAAAAVVSLQIGRYASDYLQDESLRSYSHYRKMAEPLALYLPFALALALLHTKVVARIFWMVVVVILVGLLAATGARGALAGTAAALFVWLLLRPERQFIFAIAILATATLSVMFVLDMPLLHRVGEGVMSASTMDRLGRLWPQAYEMIAAKPVLGYGYGDYYGELLRQSATHPEWVVTKPGPYGPHNNYLEIWVSAGIAALSMLIVLFAKLFSQLVILVRGAAPASTKYLALATLCAFTAHFLVRGFVEDMNWRPLGVLVGIAAALSMGQRKVVASGGGVRST